MSIHAALVEKTVIGVRVASDGFPKEQSVFYPRSCLTEIQCCLRLYDTFSGCKYESEGFPMFQLWS